AQDDRAEDGHQGRPEPGQPLVVGDDPGDQGWSGDGHGRHAPRPWAGVRWRSQRKVLPHRARFTHNTDVSVLIGPVDADEVVDLVVGVDRLAGVAPEPVEAVVPQAPRSPYPFLAWVI